MKVKDIMTRNPVVCTPDTMLPEVARMMVDRDCGQIPVIESGASPRPVGVVTDRDIIVRAVARGMNPIGMTARDVTVTAGLVMTTLAAKLNGVVIS